MSKLKARQPEAVEPGKVKGVIFGSAGVGKTWFSLAFPNPYYIDTEGGADLRHYQERLKKSGGAYMGQSDGSLDFRVIIDQVQALATEKHPYKTLIIDSITKLFHAAIANENERIVMSGKKDEFGASKKPAIAFMRRLVNWIQKLDMNVWFVAHEAAEWKKIGEERQEVGRTADVWDQLIYELHLAIQVQRRGKTYPAMGVVQKTRLLGFPDGEIFPLEYEEFSKRYGKDYIEAESKQITLATPEQVAEIVRIADLLKVSSDDIQALLDKAGAASWNELTTDQAAKTITFYTKKITGGK